MADYSKEILAELKKKGIKIGDSVVVEKDVHRFEGTLMPKSQGRPDSLIIKLANGYNTGVDWGKSVKISKSKGEKKTKTKAASLPKYKPDPDKKTVAVLSTGGTVASKIDYKTGAVSPTFTAEDLVRAIPEIAGIVNIKPRVVFQMFSEDMEPSHWIELARKIEDEISTGVGGIIITHGTDTMHYTAAALSLMVQDSPVPVLLVGSQRSTDRGSNDAALNLICAAQFIAKSDFAGVAICMHGSTDDSFCHIHDGLHVRKMHTTRRDAFKSIDVLPYAKVEQDGTIEWLRQDYRKRSSRKPSIAARFDTKVALVKVHPNFNPKVLDFYFEAGYRGLVLEGTGLGNLPVSVTDDATKHHAGLLDSIGRLSKQMIIAMTSQCLYGRVNMNVYAPQRIMTEAGVVEARMTPEAALVKLGWSLAGTKTIEDAKKLFTANVAGEILERVDIPAYE